MAEPRDRRSELRARHRWSLLDAAARRRWDELVEHRFTTLRRGSAAPVTTSTGGA